MSTMPPTTGIQATANCTDIHENLTDPCINAITYHQSRPTDDSDDVQSDSYQQGTGTRHSDGTEKYAVGRKRIRHITSDKKCSNSAIRSALTQMLCAQIGSTFGQQNFVTSDTIVGCLRHHLALTQFGRHLVREDVQNEKYTSEVHSRL
jgi:hypothetical protein